MKNFKTILGVVIAVLVVGLLYVFLVNPAEAPTPEGDMVACTMDAMQCPDGSYVGRSGPSCEFVCPDPEN